MIDVSSWQGDIDWAKAKADGVEGAIIRLGFGWGNDADAKAQRNINECKRLGIPFGIYWYSYAEDASGSRQEGNDVVSKLRQMGVSPNDLKYPVYYDLEQWTWTGHTPPTNPNVYNGIVNAWYGALQSGGYQNLGVYSYTSYLQGPLNNANIYAKTRWVAQYGARMEFTAFGTNDRGWQYTESGHINGISGSVDMSAFGVKELSQNVPIYRMYNRNSGLHHYTANYDEALDLSLKGWLAEGISFFAAREGNPVYRVYNPHDGNHHYTKDSEEKNYLVSLGWRDEGIGWFVPDKGKANVYRLYNPYSGDHVFTEDLEEYNSAGSVGWHKEGIAWQSN